MAASLRVPGGFLMSRIKFSTHIHPWKVHNKSIEIKHDTCLRLNVMLENHMVSTKFTCTSFQRKRHSRAVHRSSIKKLFRKISQTSLGHMVIGVLLYQVTGIQLATKTIARYRCFAANFMKLHRTILRRTTANDCSWTLRGVVKNSS